MEEFGANFLHGSILFAYGAMIVSFALTVYRLLRGPTPADRVVALDMLALLGIGFIGLFSISTGEYAFLDVAIALADDAGLQLAVDEGDVVRDLVLESRTGAVLECAGNR